MLRVFGQAERSGSLPWTLPAIEDQRLPGQAPHGLEHACLALAVVSDARRRASQLEEGGDAGASSTDDTTAGRPSSDAPQTTPGWGDTF
ncbi:MAG: hypothetical protein VB093_19770 [Propionicimonas sp.]|nr:hypothetical protein [Propionicimonas sp.]